MAGGPGGGGHALFTSPRSLTSSSQRSPRDYSQFSPLNENDLRDIALASGGSAVREGVRSTRATNLRAAIASICISLDAAIAAGAGAPAGVYSHTLSSALDAVDAAGVTAALAIDAIGGGHQSTATSITTSITTTTTTAAATSAITAARRAAVASISDWASRGIQDVSIQLPRPSRVRTTVGRLTSLSKSSLCAELSWRRASLLYIRGNGLLARRSTSSASELFKEGLALARSSLTKRPRSADAAHIATICLRRVTRLSTTTTTASTASTNTSSSTSTNANTDALHEEYTLLTAGLGARPNDPVLLADAGAWAYDVASLPWSTRAFVGALWSRPPPAATFQEALGFSSRSESRATIKSQSNAARLVLIFHKLGRVFEAREALADLHARRAVLGEEQEIGNAAVLIERTLRGV